MLYELFRPHLFDADSSLWSQSELPSRFNPFQSGHVRRGYPKINILQKGDHVTLLAKAPGFGLDDIEITVQDHSISLKGKRALSELSEQERYIHQERGESSFTRTFELPFPIDTEKVKAQYKKGVLEVNLERHEAHKPKKINVKVES